MSSGRDSLESRGIFKRSAMSLLSLVESLPFRASKHFGASEGHIHEFLLRRKLTDKMRIYAHFIDGHEDHKNQLQKVLDRGWHNVCPRCGSNIRFNLKSDCIQEDPEAIACNQIQDDVRYIKTSGTLVFGAYLNRLYSELYDEGSNVPNSPYIGDVGDSSFLPFIFGDRWCRDQGLMISTWRAQNPSMFRTEKGWVLRAINYDEDERYDENTDTLTEDYPWLICQANPQVCFMDMEEFLRRRTDSFAESYQVLEVDPGTYKVTFHDNRYNQETGTYATFEKWEGEIPERPEPLWKLDIEELWELFKSDPSKYPQAQAMVRCHASRFRSGLSGEIASYGGK